MIDDFIFTQSKHDETTEDVEPVCTEPGLFGHPTNCSRYHQCTPSHGKFNIRNKVCPKGDIFDETAHECRKEALVNPKPSCWHKKLKTRKIETTETRVEQTVDEGEQIPVRQIIYLQKPELISTDLFLSKYLKVSGSYYKGWGRGIYWGSLWRSWVVRSCTESCPSKQTPSYWR